MEKRKSQTEHDSLVDYVARELNKRGYEQVKADLPDYEVPKKIIWQSTGEGFEPDVTGVKMGFRIFEIETDDSIEDEHTLQQWKLFASYAKVNDAFFYVVFRKGSLEKVQNRLKELGITATLWEV